jgi:hypothetical protein
MAIGIARFCQRAGPPFARASRSASSVLTGVVAELASFSSPAVAPHDTAARVKFAAERIVGRDPLLRERRVDKRGHRGRCFMSFLAPTSALISSRRSVRRARLTTAHPLDSGCIPRSASYRYASQPASSVLNRPPQPVCTAGARLGAADESAQICALIRPESDAGVSSDPRTDIFRPEARLSRTRIASAR